MPGSSYNQNEGHSLGQSLRAGKFSMLMCQSLCSSSTHLQTFYTQQGTHPHTHARMHANTHSNDPDCELSANPLFCSVTSPLRSFGRFLEVVLPIVYFSKTARMIFPYLAPCRDQHGLVTPRPFTHLSEVWSDYRPIESLQSHHLCTFCTVHLIITLYYSHSQKSVFFF